MVEIKHKPIEKRIRKEDLTEEELNRCIKRDEKEKR